MILQVEDLYVAYGNIEALHGVSVRVEEGAVVTNSIINQNSYIQSNVTLDCVVLDKNVVVRFGKRLMGQESYPVVVPKGLVV